MKRRIEGDIKKLRQDVNLLRRDLKGELGSQKKQKTKELFEKSIKKRDWRTKTKDADKKRESEMIWVKNWTI